MYELLKNLRDKAPAVALAATLGATSCSTVVSNFGGLPKTAACGANFHPDRSRLKVDVQSIAGNGATAGTVHIVWGDRVPDSSTGPNGTVESPDLPDSTTSNPFTATVTEDFHIPTGEVTEPCGTYNFDVVATSNPHQGLVIDAGGNKP